MNSESETDEADMGRLQGNIYILNASLQRIFRILQLFIAP